MTRKTGLQTEYQLAYFRRKLAEQKLLKRFALPVMVPSEFTSPNPEEIFRKKQQIKAAIRATAALSCRLSESQLLAGHGTVVSKAFNVRLRYEYQRIRHILATRRPLQFLYPGLKIPRSAATFGMFASSCQASITCAFHVLRLLKQEKGLHLYDGAYWETLSFFKQHGFRFSEGPPPKKTKILYFDSSTQRHETPDLERKYLKGVDFLFVDTTCFPINSPELSRVINLAYQTGVVCILARSHMKLDCLGLEYGRLGSIALVWNPRVSKASRLSSSFQKCFHGMVNLYGVSASTSQFYPFLSSKAFLSANEKWLKTIQRNNRRITDDLQNDPLLKNGPFILTSFKHDLFFWISFRKRISDKKMERLLAVLSRLLSFEKIMHKNIASYPWDFIGITNFNLESPHMSSLNGLPTVRMSMADFDQETMDRVSLCLLLWFRKIRKQLE